MNKKKKEDWISSGLIVVAVCPLDVILIMLIHANWNNAIAMVKWDANAVAKLERFVRSVDDKDLSPVVFSSVYSTRAITVRE